MSLQAPEREILNFQPHIFKTTAFISAAMLITRIMLDWKVLIEGDFSRINFIALFTLLLIFIMTSSTRIILSTHSIQQKIGSFFRYEIQRSQVEAIKITPTVQYMQKKAHPILFKNLFSKKMEKHSYTFWAEPQLPNHNTSRLISRLLVNPTWLSAQISNAWDPTMIAK